MGYSSTPTPRTRTSSTSSKDTIIASSRNRLKNPNLQIVTQALHIPPKIEDAKIDGVEEINEANANEVERLKRDMKKLKDYLKTSVQERKMLVKKIGTLNERVNAAHVRKSVSPEKSTMTDSPRIDDMSFEDKSYEDLGIQCSLQDNVTQDDPHFIRFASELNNQVFDQNTNTLVPTFVNSLNMSPEAIAKLESILLENEDCKEKLISLLESMEPSSDSETRNCYRLNVTNVTNCYKRRSYIETDQFHDKSIECLEESVIPEIHHQGLDINSGVGISQGHLEMQSCSSMASSLPDPNTVDLLELSFDNASIALLGATHEASDAALNVSLRHDEPTQYKQINHDLERKRRDLEHKAVLLDAMEDQNKEKDKIIRDQAGVLEEYRMEILRLREERKEFNNTGRAQLGSQQYQHQTKKRAQRKILSSEPQQVRILLYISDDFGILCTNKYENM